MWNLPTHVSTDNGDYKITDKCDYRVVFDVFAALKDNDVSQSYRTTNALIIFYEDFSYINDVMSCVDANILVEKMYDILNCGKTQKSVAKEPQKPLMDWEQDWPILAPAINRVIGYDVRDENRYTHWYTLVGAYHEIGDCYFAQVVSIRSKLNKGKQLDKYDREFYDKNKDDIILKSGIDDESQAWLDGFD